MANDTLIDPEAIENLRALNPDDGDSFLRDIISIFLEDTPQRLVELRESLVTGDQARFIRAAHSIKGSSSNLGANQLRAVSEKLESKSKNQGLGDVDTLLTELETAFAITKTELERLVAPV